jgi:hypothetical protein
VIFDGGGLLAFSDGALGVVTAAAVETDVR